MVSKVVVGVVKVFGRLQQRLAWDATHIGASAAQGWAAFGVFPLVNTGHVHTQLGCTNGGNVAARTTTDDDDVELFAHEKSLN
jgi:hypothetical protein